MNDNPYLLLLKNLNFYNKLSPKHLQKIKSIGRSYELPLAKILISPTNAMYWIGPVKVMHSD